MVVIIRLVNTIRALTLNFRGKVVYLYLICYRLFTLWSYLLMQCSLAWNHISHIAQLLKHIIYPLCCKLTAIMLINIALAYTGNCDTSNVYMTAAIIISSRLKLFFVRHCDHRKSMARCSSCKEVWIWRMLNQIYCSR